MLFQTIPFWRYIRVSDKKLKNRFEEFFGQSELEITDRDKAIKLLLNVVSIIQKRITYRLKNENSYDMLMKLYYIFDEVNSFYLSEKEARAKLSEQNNCNPDKLLTFVENRNIMRNIIDACNIWIENAVLYQHDVDTMAEAKTRCFSMDIDLLLDLYLYGFASQGVSLLTLSQNTGQELFYGLKIIPKRNTPAEILKYHPKIFFNTAITGNQDILVENPLTPDANDTSFGKGFLKTYGVGFLLFLAVIVRFQDDLLQGDDKSLIVISKKYFIDLVEDCTNSKIDGNVFYESFVLTKSKVNKQLRKNEDIIWVMGVNKERHELRPFIGLENGNVLISYESLEQAKQLWISYFSNGGMCYTNKSDFLSDAMNIRNQELSDILVDKIREILNKVYTPKIDEKNVKYQKIFGNRDIDYGDFDVVYYCEQSKELFLIEAKYFSDSLNPSGLVRDYKKLFQKDGYYDHCRRRYELVISEPDKIKSFIGVDENISVHFIFLSSKPIELELQDTDKIVIFLSLGIFEKYIEGKLINEDNSIARPVHII